MSVKPDLDSKILAVKEASDIINKSRHNYVGWGNLEKIATVSAVLLNTVGSYSLPDYISPFQLHPATIGFTIYTYWCLKDYSALLRNISKKG